MQLKLDEEISLELNMTELVVCLVLHDVLLPTDWDRGSSELLETKYKNSLQPHYEEPIHQVITKVFRGLSGKKVIMPSKDFVRFVMEVQEKERTVLTLIDLQSARSQWCQMFHQGQRGRFILFG